jgi:TonB family protein
MILHLIVSIVLQFSSLFVDDQPVFKGGQRSLTTFIYSRLIYPEYSKDNCLQGTIQVSFKLNQQGKIYHSEVVRGYGLDLDAEALRVVRLTTGRWIMPANHDTTVAMILPVNFSLKNYQCEQRTKDEINAAINAYQAREGLSQVVFNYYDQKFKGIANPAEEARIEAIKMQLGFDDKFIQSLLRQAQQKLKQEDRQGACEDFIIIRRLGSDQSAKFIEQYCN